MSAPPTTAHGTVCLVIPPSGFLLDERVFMSLGVLKVAACLEQAGCAVELVDLSGIENYLEVIELHLSRSSATLVGLTTTTPQLPAACRIAERVRAVRPDVRLVLGGPHVTLTHSAVKQEKKAGRASRAHESLALLQSTFDLLVSGDGELAALRMLEPEAPALIDGDDPAGGLFMTDEVYDRTPFPARHLIDVASYRYTIDGERATSLIAQLGCPFGCGFCGGRNSRSLRQIRTRTTGSILRELEQVHRTWGHTGFMFYDDELNVSPSMLELMEGIRGLQDRLGTEFRLRGFVKAELFDDRQAAAMFRAGFRWILSGFESAAPRILTNINKRATLADNTRAVEVARRNGLKVKALMSVGHPGESEETVAATREWLLAVRPDDFDCTVITTYPGTPYYDQAVEDPARPGVWTYTAPRTGDRLHAWDVDFTRVAEYYKGNPDGGYRAYVFTDALGSERLVELRDEVERSVRAALGIPFNPSRAAIRYEHSMGQGPLPPHILRASPHAARRAR